MRLSRHLCWVEPSAGPTKLQASGQGRWQFILLMFILSLLTSLNTTKSPGCATRCRQQLGRSRGSEFQKAHDIGVHSPTHSLEAFPALAATHWMCRTIMFRQCPHISFCMPACMVSHTMICKTAGYVPVVKPAAQLLARGNRTLRMLIGWASSVVSAVTGML